MASLAKGLGHPSLRPLLQPSKLTFVRLSTPSPTIARSRLFATSFRVHAASPKPRIAKSHKVPQQATPPRTQIASKPAPAPAAPIPKPNAVATPATPSAYAFVKTLASKPTPTVLYENSSQFWFYFGCWTSGLSILAWTGATGPDVVFNQPEGVPEWIGYVYGSSYILLTAMGFYLISKTPNIVSSIRVLPAQLQAAAAASSARQAAAASPSTLQMEVTVQRMLPFLRPKVVTAPLDKVALRSRFSLPDEYVPELKRLGRKREEEELQREIRRRDMERILTMPFRRAARSFTALFQGVRSAWSDMGFALINVDGKDYKVNVIRGFAHDGFRTLERLVPVKPK
jgi:hypothetical protein